MRCGNVKTRMAFFGFWAIACICMMLSLPDVADAQGAPTTLEAWQSKALPAPSHPLPSWGRGGYFYVHTSNGSVYATSISDGRMTDWQNAGAYAGGPQGFMVLVAGNTPYAFRNGHVIRYDVDASNLIQGLSCLEWTSASCSGAPGAAFGEIKYMWDSAAEVSLGSGYVYHLGGFNMTTHSYDVNTMHKQPMPLTPPVRFTPAGSAPTSIPYKGAFYRASSSYGFIYMGTLERVIWRMRVNADGSHSAWDMAGAYPQGQNDRGDLFVIDDQLFVIRGKKVYQATLNAATGAISAWRDEPPDLSEFQVTLTWNATEPEPASWGIIGDYVCVTGTTRAFCAHIKRSRSGYDTFLPLLWRF